MARTAAAVAEPVAARDSGVEVTDDDEQALLSKHIVTYRLDGALFFGAAHRFLAELTAIADVRVVILRFPQLQVLDATGAQATREQILKTPIRGPAYIYASSRLTKPKMASNQVH